MGLFDFFKKKEPSYDPNNIKVTDLDVGFVFEYDMKSWVVKNIYQYDWGHNHYSYEYLIDSGDETKFLSVDEDDGLELSIGNKVKVRKIDEDLPEEISRNNKPPKKLHYDNKIFYLDEECPGFFNDLSSGKDEWDEFIAWEYYDDDEDYIITIEQWDDNEFEASYAKYVEEYEISNILPAEK